jgi:2-polyprenyl-6-methoxyphenol hydroxylase-like FAD-dependent oxidoreductase
MAVVDVVVVGAGPTGLMLACELALAGVRPLVLERRSTGDSPPKANGLAGQIVQLLDYRGLLESFSAEASFVGSFPYWPFGSVPLDFSRLDPCPLTFLAIPQPQMEALLARRADELHIAIRRGHEVATLSQDEEGVEVDVAGPAGDYRVRCGYLVGCDGARSQVRGLAGIGFPGTTEPELMRLGHFAAPDTAGLFDTSTGNDMVRPGWNRTAHGIAANARSRFALVGRILVTDVLIHHNQPSPGARPSRSIAVTSRPPAIPLRQLHV